MTQIKAKLPLIGDYYGNPSKRYRFKGKVPTFSDLPDVSGRIFNGDTYYVIDEDETYYFDEGEFKKVEVSIDGGGTSFEDLGYQPFSAAETYAAGDVVIHNGSLYRFTESHAVGAWIGTDAEETDVAELIRAGGAETAVLYTDQALTGEQQQQARENIGASATYQVSNLEEVESAVVSSMYADFNAGKSVVLHMTTMTGNSKALEVTGVAEAGQYVYVYFDDDKATYSLRASKIALLGQLATLTRHPILPEAPSDGKQYARKDGGWEEVAGKEDTANKVTSITSSSTDTQYPSAKAVYTLFDSLINGNEIEY